MSAWKVPARVVASSNGKKSISVIVPCAALTYDLDNYLTLAS
jgi:hypothetical protein